MPLGKTYQKVLTGVLRQRTKEKVILFLRTYGFEFINSGELNCPFIENKHLKYSFLIRRSRPHKKWDERLMIGIKMWGDKNDWMLIYHNGAFQQRVKMLWKDKADINFRKIVIGLKFPEYLDYQQRRDWRTEYHKRKRNPKYKVSDWFLKCEPDITIIPPKAKK